MNVFKLAADVAHALGAVATINPEVSATDMLTALGLIRKQYAKKRGVDLAVIEMNVLLAEAEAEELVVRVGAAVLGVAP